MLEVKNLDAGYGFLQVLWDVSLEVEEGEFVALVGPNGAGKSTTLKSIAGLVAPKAGEIRFRNKLLNNVPAFEISRMGLSFVSESLNLFTDMSIEENLLMGAYTVIEDSRKQENLDFVFELFP